MGAPPPDSASATDDSDEIEVFEKARKLWSAPTIADAPSPSSAKEAFAARHFLSAAAPATACRRRLRRMSLWSVADPSRRTTSRERNDFEAKEEDDDDKDDDECGRFFLSIPRC